MAAFTLGERAVRPLTADEVLRMVDAGILSEDEPVELLHGVLTAVSPKSPEHEEVKSRVISWLWPGVMESRYLVRIEAPIIVRDRTSLPEPDVAVVEPRDYSHRHPETALLVVEVAVSSLRTDTRIKPALYAAARVPELWVVDVPAQRVWVMREPDQGRYALEHAMAAGDVLVPTRVQAPPLAVADLLAGTEV
jgi:Uma2 family endonuclease